MFFQRPWPHRIPSRGCRTIRSSAASSATRGVRRAARAGAEFARLRRDRRSAGLIVTNNHVIQGGTDIRVVLADKREFEAKLLLADERTDLAVLKIDAGDEELPALPLAISTTSKWAISCSPSAIPSASVRR